MFSSKKKNCVKHTHRSMQRRSARYRPQLLCLEERLPPGDTVLGAVLGWSWIGTGLAVEGPSQSALERNFSPETLVIHRPRHDDGEAVPARQGTFIRVESSISDGLPDRQPTVTCAGAGAVWVWNTPDYAWQDWDPWSALAPRRRELAGICPAQLDGAISGSTGRMPFDTGSLVYGISSSTPVPASSVAPPRPADQLISATPNPIAPKDSQRGPGPQGGELSFADPVDYAAGRSPRSITTGHFHDPGILDLAVANFGSNDVSVFLGNGDGTFRLVETIVVGASPSFITTGHFHDSSSVDLAVADSGSNEVSILLGHGDGSFGLSHNFSVGRNPQSVAIGDLRGIGIQDLAVANRDSNNVSILLGSGDGTFAPASNIAVGGAATFVVAADFAGNGRQDLAVGAVDSSLYQRGTVSILLGNGDGTFRAGQNLAVGRGLTSMVAYDFNGHDVADLAVAGNLTDTVSVLLGRGDGTFTLDRSYQVGGQPQSIAVGDFDGDGIPDIVTVGLQSSVSVLIGNGDGTFQTTRDFWGGANPISVAVGDFNGDGRGDLVIAQNFTNQLSVVLNTNPQPPDGVTVYRDIGYYKGLYSNPQRQNLDVYVPPDRTDFPIVFLPFGGQYRNGEKSRHAYLARTLAREGYGVVTINYRTTDGSPQQVVFPGQEVDLARAFAWTYNHIAEYGGDPNNIFVMGQSSGGGVVSLLATDRSYLAAQGLSPDVIKGVIGVSGGFYDVRTAVINYPGQFNDVFGDLEQMWNASPLKYVDGTQPPFLLLYASNDNPGFPEDATAFYQTLVDAGSQAEIHMIPGRNHVMSMANAARPGDPAREYILQFIAEHTA